MKRLIISCGGTGGHFMPGLSIARTFQENGGEVLLLLGGKNAPKQMETAAKYGIVSMQFPASYPSANPIRMGKFLFHTASGYIKCRDAVKKFQPDALLAMGSFASLAPVSAAKSLNVPVFLHDGNTKLGKANLFLSRYAKMHRNRWKPLQNTESYPCSSRLLIHRRIPSVWGNFFFIQRPVTSNAGMPLKNFSRMLCWQWGVLHLWLPFQPQNL